MSAIQEVVSEAPAVEAVPKRAMTLGNGTSLIMLALLIAAPLFVKNFIIFQLTMLLIYGLAVLALNILTGGSGQFSLGQSAFYAVGAYTSAILMEHVGMNYALTLPVAGVICFAFGFLFGQPALRLSGVYLALATFALATAMPQLLKLGYFEQWTGGVQGLVVTKPDAPFGLPMSQDMWLYYFTLAITIAIYIFSVNLLKSRSGRAFMAIRDNEIAASAMGIDVALYKTLAFGVSAGITGVAGGLGAIAVQFVAPDGYTSSSSCPTSRREFQKACPARCSACCCFWSSSWCPMAHGKSPWWPSNWSASSRRTSAISTEEKKCFLKNYVSPRSRRRSSLSLPRVAAHLPKRNTTPARPTPKSRSATSCPIVALPPPTA